jgi:transcription elongation factor Elf1
LDKTQSKEQCPRCNRLSLSIYYSEGTDMKLGAVCNLCGLKGYYADGKFVALATA